MPMPRFAVGLPIMIAVVASGFAVPAYADWEYTKWGMTPVEVVAASKGIATETTAEEREGARTKNTEGLLKAPYATGEFKFNAEFHFSKDTRQLVLVHLELLNPSLSRRLIESLRAKYGTPSEEMENVLIHQILWRVGRDEISFTKVGNDLVWVRTALKGQL